MKKKVLGLISILIVVVLMFTAKKEISNSSATKSQAISNTTIEFTNQGLVINANDLVKDSTEEVDIQKNTEYLQELIDQVSAAGGGTVYLPDGTYYFAPGGEGYDGAQYVIKCKNNVTIEGSGTILEPYGKTLYGLDMFYFNDYEEGKGETYLENADFRHLRINGESASSETYKGYGRGFAINLYKNCDFENVRVSNTEGTGFELDNPINSTINNCSAKYCGTIKSNDYDEGSGIRIGIGYSENEYVYISKCTVTGNRRYGIFFKHKGLENLDMYKAVKSTGGFAVVDCVATGNLWNFGGEKSYDVTYINCYNSDNTDVDSSEFAIRFDEGSVRCSALNCDDANIFTDVSYDDNEEYNAIYWAQNNAIASGYTRTEFAPNDSCTRINALRFLYNLSRRAGDITFEEINTGIEDVDNDENKNTYADVVKWALDNKIISAEESFRPDEYITANEYLYMLWLYETGEDFDDTKSSEELYEDAFNWAISKGIVYESEFMEDVAVFNECTRGQAVTILCRYSYSLSKFPITYNLQGGTINGTENPSTYKSGEDTITLSNPTKEGYTFQGWIGEDYNNTSEDTTEGRNSYTKMNIDITENDTGAKLYTAFYTSNKYMISFDANGGTGTMEDEYFTYDKPQALLANAFTKEGYVFAGWTINADGTGTRYTDKQAISNLTANADEEITLYANWEDITYTVEHYLQNIDGTYPEEPINKSEPILGIMGEEVTAEVNEYEGFTSPEKQTITLTTNVDENVIRYEYTRNSYTVNVTKGAGIEEITGEGTYKYEEEVTLGATAKPGYDVYWTGDFETNTFNMPARDVQLAANTDMIQYSIVYELNGGTIKENGNPVIYTVETEDFTLVEPTKEEDVFLGWTGSNGDEPQKELTIKKGTTGDLTYTANWESQKVQYSVKNYLQNLLDDGYPERTILVDLYEGNIGEEVTGIVNEYEGFTSPEAESMVLSVDPTENVFKYYYTRNSYTVDVTKGTGIEEITGEGTYKYEQEVTLGATLKEGYENVYWTGDFETNTFNMPAKNVQMTANAEPIVYTITYNLDGGIEETNPTEYTIETDDIVLNQPTREGYVFLGWTGSNGTTPQTEVTIEEGTIGNLTYTANWKDENIKYTVEHYLQNIDETYPEEPTYISGPKDGIIGEEVTEEVNEYEGFTSPEPETKILSVNDDENIFKYYYTRNSYTVNVTKGTGIEEVTGAGEYKYEEKVTLEAILKPGYKDASWSGDFETNIFNMPAKDVQMTVNAEAIQYSIVYELNGGIIQEEGNPVIYTVETEDFTLVEPTKEGHIFLGWTGSNGTTPQKDLTIEKGTIGNLTYTANWKEPKVQYTIEYYLQNIDGTYPTTPNKKKSTDGTIGSQVTGELLEYEGFTLPEEETITLDENADKNVIKYYYTRNSYNVQITIGKGIEKISGAGQYKYGEEVTLQEFVNDGYRNAKWTGDFTTNTFYMPAKNVQMSVNAELIEYIITYNLNGGNVEGNPTRYTIETEDITLENPSRIGYTFVGWTGSNGEEPEKEVTIEKGTTGDLSFTAEWEVIPTEEPDELEVEISYNIKELTNKNVIVTISANNKIKSVEGWTLSEDGKSISKVYEQNAEETVTIIDEYNNEIEQSVVVNNIDRTSPGVTIEYVEQDNCVIVVVTANEELQEIDGWELSSDKKVMRKAYYVNKEEEVSFLDLAGNETTKSIKIDSIDILNDNNENDNAGDDNNDTGSGDNGNNATESDVNVNTEAGDKTDTTVSDKIIPAAGMKYVLGIGLIIILLGAISLAKVKKYKDIN